MRYATIKSHLKPYVIVARRKTTINHAFAAAVAPNDDYDAKRVRKALTVLGQDPDADLLCAYCGEPAQTWDHVFATVRKSEFSGRGHRLGNLLPCCKACNSAKGNKDWKTFLAERRFSPARRRKASRTIGKYLKRYSRRDAVPATTRDYKKLTKIRANVMALLKEADEIAEKIRARRS